MWEREEVGLALSIMEAFKTLVLQSFTLLPKKLCLLSEFIPGQEKPSFKSQRVSTCEIKK